MLGVHAFAFKAVGYYVIEVRAGEPEATGIL
jgi:hypothetical protein